MNQRSTILGIVGGCAVVIALLGIAFWSGNRRPATSVVPAVAATRLPEPKSTPISTGVSSSTPANLAAPAASIPAAIKPQLAQAEQAVSEGRWAQARQAYQKILQEHPDLAVVAEIQQRLGEINLHLLSSPGPDPAAPFYTQVEIQPGDTLGRIARQHKTTVELLQKANGLTSDKILVGKKLKVPQVKFSIIVDKSQNILTLKADEEVVKTYLVSTGSEDKTPVGTFTIINKLVDPPWYTTQGVIPAGSPENILGTRWLGFSKPGFGIHGTTDPAAIGKSVTAGCVRMRNNEVEELYTLIPLGTEVTILD